MAREDFTDAYNPEDMTDDDLYDTVVQLFREHPNLDADWIDVEVKDGVITLSGRVGTDGEIMVAESVLSDTLGVESYVNQLVVDSTHRADQPEAADDAAGDVDGPPTDPDRHQMDTAKHLAEDLESDAFGAEDMQTAIQEGKTYEPPNRNTPGGYGSNEKH